MNKVKTVDFSGETIYCGLDVHKTNIKVNARLMGTEIASFSQNVDPVLLTQHFTSRYPGAKLKMVYEAGFCGFGLQRSLTRLGVDCIVVNAADVPSSDKDRKRKNDRRDARKLCLELSKESLNGIYIPDPAMEHVRCLVRYRRKLVGDQTRTTNRIRQLMNCQGLQLEEGCKRMSLRLVALLQSKDWGSPTLNQVMKHSLDAYLNIRKIITGITRDIKHLSKDPSMAKVQTVLQSIDGIGLISAMEIQTEIGDINRFTNLDGLAGFAGLVPDIHSSNDRYAVRGITKRANGYLRETLVECSWMLIRKDPAMLLKYNEYKQRSNSNKAIIRVAKHLLSRIRYVWMNNECYKRSKLA